MNEHSDREVIAFNGALELPPDQRAAYLARACAGDPALRRCVERMLRSHEQVGGFLEHPVSGIEFASVPVVPGGVYLQSKEKAGDRIGRYKLLEQIGEGGCGVVYMAEQEEPVRRKVALKVIKLGMDTKSVIARFEAERQALALMDHANIARVLDAGATDTGRPFFVMELVRGIRITQYCDQNSLSTRERLDLFVQVCRAIQHAHQKGVIHRDIKPSNILVTVNEPGSPGVPKVIDFGIAKATEGRLTDKTLFTAFEQFVGTPAYMSPEQAVMTCQDVDTRSDIYSLGVLLYELLTGRTPFDHAELMLAGLDEMRRIIREKEPARPSTRVSTLLHADLTTVAEQRHTDAPKLIHSLRGDLDWIVMKALEKDRARRYPTANGLGLDVQRHLNDEPIVARPPSRFYLAQKLVRRNKLATAAAGAVTAALVVGLGLSTWMFLQEKQASRRAEAASAESKATLEASDFSQAVRLIAEDNRGSALVYLARILASDPTNEAASTCLTSLLTYHSWMVPTFTLLHGGGVTTAKFSPDGNWIVTACDDGTVRVWNADTGLPMGEPLRHRGRIELLDSINFSPDGQSIVTASVDGTARVWETRARRPITELSGHTNAVYSAQFSPDGKWVVTSSADNTARVWDARSGRPVIAPLKHEGVVVCAEFSPDGQRIVTASYQDHKARVWDAQNGTLLATLLGHSNWVNSARFSPDGKSVLTASYDGTARIWDAQSGQPLTPPSQHHGSVRNPMKDARFSPDGKSFVTASFDGTVGLWETETGLSLVEPLKHGKYVSSVQFSRDGKRVLSASWDQTVRVWDAQTGQPLTEPMKHGSGLTCAQFSPDGTRIVSACADRTAKVWDTQSRPASAIALKHDAGVLMAQFSPDGTRVLTASSDHTARLWDALTGQQIGEPLPHNDVVQMARFSRDGRRIATASLDGTARVWDAQTGRPITPLLKHDKAVWIAQFSPDGSRIVTASEDDTARVWDARSGQLVVKPLKHPARVQWAEFSPDGQRIVTASRDNSARVWDATSGRLISGPLKPPDPSGSAQPGAAGKPDDVPRGYAGMSSVEFSRDGKRVLTGSYDGTAWVWDVESGHALTGPLKHNNGVVHARFSPDGERILTASWDQKARVWDAWTGQLLIEPMDHRSGVSMAQFSPDGKRIVTCSDDRTARVWDAATGLPLTEPLEHSREVWWAEFSPDGKRIVTASEDKAARIWDIAPREGKCPDWVLPLAEAISGQALNKRGVLEETKLDRAERLKQIRQRLQVLPADDWVIWGRWFLADLGTRAISPFSTLAAPAANEEQK